APEQCMGCEVDARTDIYACGVLLYRLVTGIVPFGAGDTHPLEICQRHLGEEPRPPRALAPWIKPSLEAIILKALRKAPSERHQSANELRQELAAVLAEMEQIEMEETRPFLRDSLVSISDAEGLLASAVGEIVAQARPEVMSLPVASLGVPTIDDPPTETTVGRGATANKGKVREYLPAVALAAAIG